MATPSRCHSARDLNLEFRIDFDYEYDVLERPILLLGVRNFRSLLGQNSRLSSCLLLELLKILLVNITRSKAKESYS